MKTTKTVSGGLVALLDNGDKIDVPGNAVLPVMVPAGGGGQKPASRFLVQYKGALHAVRWIGPKTAGVQSWG